MEAETNPTPRGEIRVPFAAADLSKLCPHRRVKPIYVLCRGHIRITHCKGQTLDTGHVLVGAKPFAQRIAVFLIDAQQNGCSPNVALFEATMATSKKQHAFRVSALTSIQWHGSRSAD